MTREGGGEPTKWQRPKDRAVSQTRTVAAARAGAIRTGTTTRAAAVRSGTTGREPRKRRWTRLIRRFRGPCPCRLPWRPRAWRSGFPIMRPQLTITGRQLITPKRATRRTRAVTLRELTSRVRAPTKARTALIRTLMAAASAAESPSSMQRQDAKVTFETTTMMGAVAATTVAVSAEAAPSSTLRRVADRSRCAPALASALSL